MNKEVTADIKSHHVQYTVLHNHSTPEIEINLMQYYYGAEDTCIRRAMEQHCNCVVRSVC